MADLLFFASANSSRTALLTEVAILLFSLSAINPRKLGGGMRYQKLLVKRMDDSRLGIPGAAINDRGYSMMASLKLMS